MNPKSAAFQLQQIRAQQQAEDAAYLEFFRADSMSIGLYALNAGSDDPQQPHNEDEIYFVTKGKGNLRVDDEDFPVSAGSILYVAAGVPHYFHQITEDLEALVLFAPAES